MNYQCCAAFLWWFCLFLPLNQGAVAAQSPEIKPQPIYPQCQQINTGTDASDAIARAVTALGDADAGKRRQAAQTLSRTCDGRAVEPLIAALKDADPLVRIAALEALGRLGPQSAIEPLIELVGDPDWRVRLALVSALASFSVFKARVMVVNGIAITGGTDFTNENDLRVRCAAILTCNQLTDVRYSRKALLFVYNFLAASHPRMRELAEETMFALKDTRNGPTELMAILKNDHNPVLRRWAALWLGKLAVETTRDALQAAAASDPDPGVRQTATAALKPPAKAQ